MSSYFDKAFYYKDSHSGKSVFHLPCVFYLSQGRGKPRVILDPSQLEDLSMDFFKNRNLLKDKLVHSYYFSKNDVRNKIINKCNDRSSYLAKDYILFIFNQLKRGKTEEKNNIKGFNEIKSGEDDFEKDFKSKEYDLKNDLYGYDPRFRPEG